MKVLCTSVLAFEIVVVLLSIPVALTGDSRTGLVVACALGLVGLLVVALGVLRRAHGLTVGWIAQGAILAYGLIEPWMFLVGGVFVVLWWAAIHYGSKVEAAGRLAQESEGEVEE